MRLFFAIELPEAVKYQVQQLYLPELQQLRWTPADNLHLTLLFLGDYPQHQLDQLIETVAEISFSPFQLTLEGIGHFRSGITWLGVKPEPVLDALHKKIKHQLSRSGIAFEQRRFIPHITLARSKKIDPMHLAQIEQRAMSFSERFTVESFELKSSQLKTTGAVYTTEALFLPD